MDSKIKFKNRIYNLFASLTFPLLYQYDFSDEFYDKWSKAFVGAKHGILGIIPQGVLHLYISDDDFANLKLSFEKKIKNPEYPDKLFRKFELADKEFADFLESISKKKNFTKKEIRSLYQKQRKIGSPLDALLNAHHMFTLLFERELREAVKGLADNDEKKSNQLFVEMTKPIRKTKLSLEDKVKVKDTKIKLPKLQGREKIIQSVIRNGAYIKDYVEGIFFGKEKFLDKLYNEIVKLIGIKREDILYLTRGEIIEYIKKNKKVAKKLIKDRKRLTVCYKGVSAGGRYYILEGDKAKEFLKKGGFKGIKEKEKPGKTLTGQVASLGEAKGGVRVILDPAQLKDFKKDEILVSLYTAVEYVPAMKKAKAILTETGGITSHSAVVSRELGKPCIIALNNVTKILKTGDLVEVDANKGVVKILKK